MSARRGYPPSPTGQAVAARSQDVGPWAVLGPGLVEQPRENRRLPDPLGRKVEWAEGAQKQHRRRGAVNSDGGIMCLGGDFVYVCRYECGEVLTVIRFQMMRYACGGGMNFVT